MRILKNDYLDDYNIIIISLLNRNISIDRIIKSLTDMPCVFTIIDRNAVFCDEQIINATLYLLELKEYKKWIKNQGLRFLALIVGERQIKNALIMGNPEAENSLLIILCKTKFFNNIVNKIKQLNLDISKPVKYGDRIKVSNQLNIHLDMDKDLCKFILEKQAELRIEIEKET